MKLIVPALLLLFTLSSCVAPYHGDEYGAAYRDQSLPSYRAPASSSRRMVTGPEYGSQSSTYYHSGNVTGTSSRIGGTYYHPDGSTSTKIGNTYHHSRGGSSTRIGNTVHHSNGGSSSIIGNSVYHSDGSSSTIIGNSIHHSGGYSNPRGNSFYRPSYSTGSGSSFGSGSSGSSFSTGRGFNYSRPAGNGTSMY
ncbi:MAG TPA: hypothetical protein VGE29_11265 [Prosthecobacter sp.]